METKVLIAILVGVITVSGMIIAAIVNYLKAIKQEENWEKPVSEVKKEMENHKLTIQAQISELHNKINLLNVDSSSVNELKQWILRIEDSIGDETNKLERKVDDLMKLVIDLMRGKK